MNYAEIGTDLQKFLKTERQAVAVSFLETPPAGVPRVQSSQPASCSYWKLASDGEVFYTTAADQQNCVIGAYTHGVPLLPEKTTELHATLGQMIGLNYLQQEEIPQIPHRAEPFHVAVYSPLALSPCDPQAVIIRGNAQHIMLLAEAAARAGIVSDAPTMRPTCAFLPATLQTGHANPSFACIGNRVYTDMAAGELYYAVPGSRIADVVAQLATIVSANEALEAHHRDRLPA
jgi:uncharacterized protein (DUF169 family)